MRGKYIVMTGLLSWGCASKNTGVDLSNGGEATQNATPEDSEKKAQSTSIEIKQVYEGQVFERKTLQPSTSKSYETMVIRHGEELEQFVARIPKKKIQKKQPAPPSEDPLLNKKDFDWQQSMLIVVMRFDNNYASAPIKHILREEESLVVVYQPTSLSASRMLASMSGVGTYYMVEIPQESTTVQFIEKEAR